MLAMVSAPAAEDRTLLSGGFELGFGKHRSDRRSIFVLKFAWIRPNPAVDRRLLNIVHLEQLGDEPPVPVEPFGHPARAFFGAVAEPHSPFGREVAVIGDFLHRLVSEFGEE